MTQTLEQFAAENAKLAANKAASDYAVEVVQMCGIQPQRFWECLKSLCENRLPAAKPAVERNPAMTDRDASLFETCAMPYGKHAGESIEDVPVDYLIFLAEGDEFSRRLKSYVKSKRFAQRQDDESE